MSSFKFAARLRVSRALRQLVLASGGFLTLSGIAMILTWPVDAGWRMLLALAWGVCGCWKLAQLRRAYMSYGYIEVGTGDMVRLHGEQDATVAAELLPGSVLLEHLGWLRLRTPAGVRIAELVYGNPRKNKDWRRLQVIWRHR